LKQHRTECSTNIVHYVECDETAHRDEDCTEILSFHNRYVASC